MLWGERTFAAADDDCGALRQFIGIHELLLLLAFRFRLQGLVFDTHSGVSWRFTLLTPFLRHRCFQWGLQWGILKLLTNVDDGVFTMVFLLSLLRSGCVSHFMNNAGQVMAFEGVPVSKAQQQDGAEKKRQRSSS